MFCFSFHFYKLNFIFLTTTLVEIDYWLIQDANAVGSNSCCKCVCYNPTVSTVHNGYGLGLRPLSLQQILFLLSIIHKWKIWRELINWMQKLSRKVCVYVCGACVSMVFEYACVCVCVWYMCVFWYYFLFSWFTFIFSVSIYSCLRPHELNRDFLKSITRYTLNWYFTQVLQIKFQTIRIYWVRFPSVLYKTQ